MDDDGKFWVHLYCNRCHEKADYGFVTAESQLEYIRLWNGWHDIPGHTKHGIEPAKGEGK